MYSRLAFRAASPPAWIAARPSLGAPATGSGARRTVAAFGAFSETTNSVAKSSTLLIRAPQGAKLDGTWELPYSASGAAVRHPQVFWGKRQFVMSPRGGSRCLSTQGGGDDTGKEGKKADADEVEEEAGKESERGGEEVVIALKEDLAESEDQLQDTREKVLYLAAEMENVRAIAKRDAEGARLYAVQKFAKQLLNVADNLERAVASAKEGRGGGGDSSHDVLLQGVEMTSDELQKIFRTQGLEKYGEVGDKFDPHLHDAMFAYPDPAQEHGTVGQILKCGYKLRGRVIRAAQVGTVKHA